MKTKEELNALKVEVETLNKKLSTLTDDELKQVTGGLYVVKVPNPFEILDNCKKCGLCLKCPYDCISIGTSKYVIDRTVCVGCGYCASRCPENAIQPCFN